MNKAHFGHKNIFFIIFFFIFAQTCFSQSLFFDNLNNSVWTSTQNISEAFFKDSKKIGLSKLIVSRDSINRNVSIWSFKDGELVIENYNYQQKNDGLPVKCKYEIKDKTILQITTPNNGVLKYKIGIVSTGNYVLLFRLKERAEVNSSF